MVPLPLRNRVSTAVQSAFSPLRSQRRWFVVIPPEATQSRTEHRENEMPEDTGRVALYAAVGPELTHYAVDVEAATLARQGTLTIPANVHYCWPHVSGRVLYVASSDSASGVGGFVGTKHQVTALRVDPGSGALSRHGESIPLPTRPIHMTTDIPSQHILVAFSNPSGLCVYRVNPDGTPGDEVGQPEAVYPGIYAHQVRVRLDNRKVILVSRGHDAAAGKAEEPGGLHVFAFCDGPLNAHT